MSFLTPLYALAALAIVAPVLFHLVRRKPKDHYEFSSHLFLDPEPPRLTRSSRIDQWMLLLLRSIALILVAAAFSRPYWDTPISTDSTSTRLRRMVLVDTSASMQRDGLMAEAKRKASEWIGKSGPNDATSLYSFDRELRSLVSVEQSLGAASDSTVGLARKLVEQLEPTWHETNLGQSLATALDLLQNDYEESSEAAASSMEIVLISDLQSGAQLDALANIQWPPLCSVRIERIPSQTNAVGGNARALLLTDAAENKSELESSRSDANSSANEANVLRARVTNSSDSDRESFVLEWIDRNQDPISGTQVSTEVPRGRTQVVKVSSAPEQAVALQLRGDKSSFDNRHYVATSKPQSIMVRCIEPNAIKQEESLAYFWNQVPVEVPGYFVQSETVSPDDIAKFEWSPSKVPLAVVSHAWVHSSVDHWKSYVENGGHLVWVWDRPIGSSAVASSPLDRSVSPATYLSAWQVFFGTQFELENVSEAKPRDYSMWEQIQFQHPLFRDLADSKFNDFTKVRFWHHRRMQWSEKDGLVQSLVPNDDTREKIIVMFDDDSTAIAEMSLGKGKVTVLTSGWQPVESQLALSSKFVPIVSNLVRSTLPARVLPVAYRVGDGYPLENVRSIRKQPDTAEVESWNEGTEFRFREPGVYEIGLADASTQRIAVNLSESESQLQPLDLAVLGQLGVPLRERQSLADSPVKQRQLRAIELEAQQGSWRWILVAVLGLVAVESFLCIRAKGEQPA